MEATDAAAVAAGHQHDPLFLQQLLGEAGASTPAPAISAVSVSALLLPASPDFLRFQGRLAIAPASSSSSSSLSSSREVRCVQASMCDCKIEPPRSKTFTHTHEEQPPRPLLALPLALSCGAPGGPVLLESLRGDTAFQRLWAATVTTGHEERCVRVYVCLLVVRGVRTIATSAAHLQFLQLPHSTGSRNRAAAGTWPPSPPS